MQIEKFINEKAQILQVSEYDFQYNEINNSTKKFKLQLEIMLFQAHNLFQL